MGITDEKLNRTKISEGCHIQRFFRNKVFYGIENQPLKRKAYRGKRDKYGKRKNEIFYVNETQDIRIEEELLIDSLNQILESITDTSEIDIYGWNASASKKHFELKQACYLRNKECTIEEYKGFISSCIESRDCQVYENIRLRKMIDEGNFKDIIEKIEVYETGIVCIFTNAFEIALQF